ncbi:MULTISPECIES: metallophosphoesterase family protein [unclassified Archaeoglobus]|jgi:DNA repair exonuclease SbcCD nuclease subunit|uniref:metallophosphoesterase family protein n=1 Tax=unclassified Archaeoglobus TaxID=2643606 RepID=UPI0025BFD77D|nr:MULTISPECIES: exonuclease SbcCD subunit D [unclassified Archaeoglobus]
MRIAHISDTHLGYRQYNLDERENDFYEAFNEAIEKAIEERADVLIHSGDLFDSPTPPIKALYVFKNALRKIDGKMKMYTILGDHDVPKRRGMPPHKLFDIRVLGVGRLEWEEVNGVLIAGISNLRGRGVELLKEEFKKFDAIAEKYEKSVLIAHQAIERYLPFEGAYELKEDDLPRKATYYALGHLHSRIAARFGDGYLAYAGSTEIIRKDEISSWSKKGKGFYLVDLDGDEVTIHEVNLDIRPQLEVEVEEDNLEEVLNFVNYPKPPILHITIKGENVNRQYAIERLSELLKDKVLSFKPSFRDLSQPSPPELPKGSIDLKSIMREYLGSDEFTELAMNLFERLSQDDIEGAKKVAEEFLEEVVEGDNKES